MQGKCNVAGNKPRGAKGMKLKPEKPHHGGVGGGGRKGGSQKDLGGWGVREADLPAMKIKRARGLKGKSCKAKIYRTH